MDNLRLEALEQCGAQQSINAIDRCLQSLMKHFLKFEYLCDDSFCKDLAITRLDLYKDSRTNIFRSKPVDIVSFHSVLPFAEVHNLDIYIYIYK